MCIATAAFSSYNESVFSVLNSIGAADVLSRQTAVLIKPNLVNSSIHPVTTPSECCEAVVRYVRRYSRASIVIAEGCGRCRI